LGKMADQKGESLEPPQGGRFSTISARIAPRGNPVADERLVWVTAWSPWLSMGTGWEKWLYPDLRGRPRPFIASCGLFRPIRNPTRESRCKGALPNRDWTDHAFRLGRAFRVTATAGSSHCLAPMHDLYQLRRVAAKVEVAPEDLHPPGHPRFGIT
jgi:hypothetical protein